jgi:hypothetical protein
MEAAGIDVEDAPGEGFIRTDGSTCADELQGWACAQPVMTVAGIMCPPPVGR